MPVLNWPPETRRMHSKASVWLSQIGRFHSKQIRKNLPANGRRGFVVGLGGFVGPVEVFTLALSSVPGGRPISSSV